MKKLKKSLAAFLVVLMLLTSVPVQSFTGIELPDWFGSKAEAAGVSGYSAYAAAAYAKAWWNGRNDSIWSDYDLWGGDCANFVAQALYAGGIPMTPSWYFHKRIGLNANAYSTERTETWTLVNKLYKYLISIGGQEINSPSSSQISVGDVIVYDWDLNGRYDHSAIVVDIINGTPQIACHYRYRTASTIYDNRDRCTTNWTLGGDIRGIKLIKLYGATCWNNAPSYDAYMVTANSLTVRSGPGTGYSRVSSVGSDYIIHVTEKSGNWGKCKGKGYEGWVYLPGYTRYITHVESIKVTHDMGDWYTVTKATCVDDGLERRDCRKCDYYETRVTTCGGHKAITPATCLDASFCSACGAIIGQKLGHDYVGTVTVEPTCTKEGEMTYICSRDSSHRYTEIIPSLGHNYVPKIKEFPFCETEGSSYYECTRCKDSKLNDSEWTGFTDLTTEEIALVKTFPNEWYETRTEYRYRDKKYDSFESSSSTASKSGWNWYNTTSRWGDYGDWSNWQDQYVAGSDSRQVETRVVEVTPESRTYTYDGYVSYNCYGSSSSGYWSHFCLTCGKALGGDWSSRTYTQSNPATQESLGQQCGHSASVGGGKYPISYRCNDGGRYYRETVNVTPAVTKEQYRYQDRNLIYTHYFWQWGNWSAWTPTVYNKTSEKDVETKTTYNIKKAAMEHDWSAPYKEMLCEYSGTEYTKDDCYVILKKCNRCGVKDKAEVVKHKYPDFNTERDQYTLISNEGGYKVYRGYCRNADCVCYIDKTEKSCVFTQTVVAPTCTEDGYTINTCIYHGETFNSDYTDAVGHNMGEWYTTVPETCEENGVERRDCLNSFCSCTYYEERERTALGHIEVVDPGYDPTCTKTGLTDGSHCERCDKILVPQEEIPALGHNEGIWVCTNEGYEDLTFNSIEEIDAYFKPLACGTSFHFERNCTRVCYDEVCGEWLEDYDLSASECNFVEADRTEPTCTIEGVITYECLECGKLVTDYIDALGHLPGEEKTKHATCTEDGLVYWECQRKGCDHIETIEELESTGHALSPNDDGYAASDDKMELISSVKNVCGDGSIDTYQCTHIDENTDIRCDYTVVIGEAKGHNMSGWYVETPATCEEWGEEVNKCTNEGCTYYEARDLEPIDHDYKAAETVDPTCTENGYTLYVCQNDASHTYEGDETPALGHDWDYEYDERWKEITAPGYYNEGLEQRECQRCHIIEQRKLPALEKPKYIATFVVPDLNGTIEIEGEKYTYLADVEFEQIDLEALEPDTDPKTVIIPPNLPEKDGYTGAWEDYELKNENFYVRAEYTKKDSSNESELVEKKEVVAYNNGVATISLSAFAETQNVKVSLGGQPCDVVFVLDKSRSMSDTMMNNMISYAKAFVQQLYDSSNGGTIDHRVALVSFSGGNHSGYMVEKGKLETKTADITAWMDAYDDKNTIDEIIAGVESLQSTGTRSDLGLDFAADLLSALGDASDESNTGRKRMVVFITDGEPSNSDNSFVESKTSTTYSKKPGGSTQSSKVHEGVANAAIDVAYKLKNTYSATVYSVGVETSTEETMLRFMNYVSSNYPKAKALDDGGTAALEQDYYVLAEDSSNLETIFKDIFAQQVSNTISFNKVSFFDTITKEFTLTIQQEDALRKSVKAEYGISDDDILVMRNEDGTTDIIINNLIPQKVYENGVQTGWGVYVTFEVSANENMLGVGTYYTNTEDAGILHNGELVEKFEIPEGITVSENRYIVEFTIDGETYAIYEGEFGEGIEFPDCDYAQWEYDDAEYISDGYVVIDTDVIQNYKYSTTWYIDGVKTYITYYNPGDEIVAPAIPEKEGFEIVGWSPEVPAHMPEYAMTFNAVYSATHDHIYDNVIVSGSCDEGVVYTTYTCWCGESYTEETTTTSHTYVSTIHELSDASYVSSISCSVCGQYSEKKINYIAVYDDLENTVYDGLPGNAGNTNGNGDLGLDTDNVTTTVIDLTLLDGETAVQPGEDEGYSIIVKIPLTEALRENKDSLMVYRLNEDDSTEAIKHEIDGDYLVLYLDHFSYYVITTAAYKSADPNYAQAYCAFHGHNYDCVITGASVDGQSYMTYTCKNCDFVYSTSEVEGGCDGDCHSSFFGRIWRFICTILNSLFGTNLYCCPDMDKYLDDIGSMT